jgi:hypothetical protein
MMARKAVAYDIARSLAFSLATATASLRESGIIPKAARVICLNWKPLPIPDMNLRP